MGSTILKGLKRVLGYTLTAGLIISGGSFVYSQYSKMEQQVEKMQTPYFESYSFMDRLVSSSSYILYDKFNEPTTEQEENETYSYDVPYWEYALDRYPQDLDYYAVSEDGLKEDGRQSELLKQLIGEETDETVWNELKSRYQFVIEFRFDESGNVSLEELYGAGRVEVERLINQLFYYNTQQADHQFKSVTFVYGVPSQLSENGYIAHELQYYDEGHYVIVSIPYLIVSALLIVLFIFILPFKWIKNSGLVKGLLLVPLELRFLFVIGTGFAVIGAPFLIMATETGILSEMIEWTVHTNQVDSLVSLINIFCWSSFVAVMAVHALYVKEFFIIGPWKMLRRHTVMGQIYGLFRRKHEVETMVEEKIVYQESPAFLLIKERLLSLTNRLKNLQESLDEQETLSSNEVLCEEVKAVNEELELLLQLSTAQRIKTEVNFSKLIADVLAKMPESFNEFELKTKMPNASVTVLAYQNQLTTVMEQLFSIIENEAFKGSRIYLEIEEQMQSVELTLRYVVCEEIKMSDELNEWLRVTMQEQDGSYDCVRDGDLVKFILRVSKK